MNPVTLSRLFDEQFLVLELGPDTVRGMLLALDREKHLRAAKTFPVSKWGTTFRYPHLPFKPATAIVGCDSTVAYTALIPVHAIRERIREPLRQVELETLLSQTTAKHINQCRVSAAAALAADEIDVVLAKSRVADFTIDGHEVLNPIGLRAQKIEAVLELTLVTRAAYEEAKRATGTRDVFFTEIAYAELSVLEKVEQAPVRLLRLRPWRSSSFVREPAQIGYHVTRGELGWTLACFENAIQEAWGVSRSAARAIYEDHLAHAHSPHAERFLGKLARICAQLFMKEFEASGLKGPVYLDTSMQLPFTLPFTRRGAALTEPPLSALLERFGFTLNDTLRGVPPSFMLSALAPFFENFYDRGGGGMNEWLRTRLHWLGAPVAKR